MKLVKESINFTRGEDPLSTMGIGKSIRAKQDYDYINNNGIWLHGNPSNYIKEKYNLDIEIGTLLWSFLYYKFSTFWKCDNNISVIKALEFFRQEYESDYLITDELKNRFKEALKEIYAIEL